MTYALKLQAGGTLNPRRHIYIVRPEDDQLFELLLAGEYVNVLTSRQMGKSSLMMKTTARLAERGVRFVAIDLAGEIGTPDTAEAFYVGLLNQIVRDLALTIDLVTWWPAHAPETLNQRLLRFFREVVGEQIAGPVLIFLDEIDSTLKLPFTDDLFTALRAMYNDRPLVQVFERISFCLLGVATANELIKDRRTTPYNIGETLTLRDFDAKRDDLSPLLAVLHNDIDTAHALLTRILQWSGGHPYLTIKLCHDLKRFGISDPDAIDTHIGLSFEKLEGLSGDDHFKQILRFFQSRSTNATAALREYERILNGELVNDQNRVSHADLKLSGLVKRNANGFLVIRNQIYKRLFDRRWLQTQIPLIFQVGGTLHPSNAIYIERPEDKALLGRLLADEYVALLGPPQTGKSSMVARSAAELQKNGVRCGVIDLVTLGRPMDAEDYFQGLTQSVVRCFDVDPGDWWVAHPQYPIKERFVRFFREVVAERVTASVVIFFDNIESTLGLSFADEFFAAISTMHRARCKEIIWRRITFCLSGVVTLDELGACEMDCVIFLADFDLSPDNFMTVPILLCDDPKSGTSLLTHVLSYTGGHPYLTMKICESIRTGVNKTTNDIDDYVKTELSTMESARTDGHILSMERLLDSRVSDWSELANLYNNVLHEKTLDDQGCTACAELKLLGLVKCNESGSLSVRNPIYERLFDHRSIETVVRNLAPTPPAPPKPLRIPSPWFRGRTQHMETLKSTIMGQSPGRAVVYGGPGVGKTELCIQLFYDQDIRSTFGGNMYFVDLQDSKFNDIAFKISEALDLRIFSANQLEHVKRELAQSRSLLVLDNFQAPFANDRKGCAEFIRELVFGDPLIAGDHQAPFHLVVSLRGNEWLADVLPWTTDVWLEPLDMDDSTALFNNILNNKFANDPDLPRVINLTGGLPLIVELMAHHAETVPSLREVIKRYRTALEQRYIPELISRPDDIDEVFWGPLGQSLALTISDPRLKNEGRRLLSVLSCLPHGLAYEDLDEIFASDVWRGAGQLEQTGLASQSRERDRLYLLEPIRAYVQRGDPPTEKDFQSLTDYFLKLADRGNYVHKESGSIWRKKLASEFANIQIMIDKGLESRDGDLETRAMLAAVALGRYQRFAGRGSTELLDKAISLPGNTKAIKRALAECRRRRGSIMNTKAIKRSIALAECRRRRGSIMQMRSDPGGAIKDFESAQAIYEGLPQAAETTFGIAQCLSNVAESKRLLSEDLEAIILFEKALDLFAQAKTLAAPNTRDDEITRGEAFCYQRLGALGQGNMEYDEARAKYTHALMLFTEGGDLIGQALCKKGIGDLEMLSDKNMARKSYDEALRLFEEAQFERGAADCRYSLGDLEFLCGDFEQALVMYQHAKNGYEKAVFEHGKAKCIYSISDIRLIRLCSVTCDKDRPSPGEATDPAMFQQLRADYEKAKLIFQRYNDYIEIANCAQGISDILLLQGDTEGAARLREVAATLVHHEFKNTPESPDDLLWAKPTGCFSGRWRK